MDPYPVNRGPHTLKALNPEEWRTTLRKLSTETLAGRRRPAVSIIRIHSEIFPALHQGKQPSPSSGKYGQVPSPAHSCL